MKLFGMERVDGGVAVATPSGRHLLIALPGDRKRCEELVGRRVLDLLEDEGEPHATRTPVPRPQTEDDEGDALSALEAGLEV